jgi:hypothetical protein
MTHLDDEQLLDAAEGRLEAAAAAHVDACPSCHAQVRELRDVLAQVALVESPAPSPLFWDHFHNRVRAALDPVAESSRPGGSLFGFRWLSVASVALTLALVTAAALTTRQTADPIGGPRALVDSSSSQPASVDDLDEDDAWALVRSLADDLDYDVAREAGVTPAPGALERAAAELSATEQSALIRLLEEEMKRTDS